MTDLIIQEQTLNGVVLLRLNRPDALNALNMELRQQLTDKFFALSMCELIRMT